MRAWCVIALLAGCAGSVRYEVGARRGGNGETVLRLGATMGVGLGTGRSATPRTFAKTLVQAVGYRRQGGNAVTTATRYARTVGPLLVNGAVELASDGLELVPAILIPVRRSSECPWYASVCDEWTATSLGLQIRAGRDDDSLAIGVDAVLAFDGYSDLLTTKDD